LGHRPPRYRDRQLLASLGTAQNLPHVVA
jgi:hypothetical protein